MIRMLFIILTLLISNKATGEVRTSVQLICLVSGEDDVAYTLNAEQDVIIQHAKDGDRVYRIFEEDEMYYRAHFAKPWTMHEGAYYHQFLNISRSTLVMYTQTSISSNKSFPGENTGTGNKFYSTCHVAGKPRI